MLGLSPYLGIDLGTSSILVWMRGQGIVLREPCVVALSRQSKQIVAVGEQARQMLGRASENIIASRPLQQGVIADFTVTRKMLSYLFDRVCGLRRLFKPHVALCVPCAATAVESRAVLEAATAAGAKRAYPVPRPVAAGLGAGIAVNEPCGHLVVDMGGGSTDIGVVSLASVVRGESLRTGGADVDDAIGRWLKRSRNIVIGERTAEEIKIAVGTVGHDGDSKVTVSGRHAVSGLPASVEVSSSELREALLEPAMAVVQSIKRLLEQAPPELCADIAHNGITLTGGASLLRGFPQLLEEQTGLRVRMADDPLCCVALGTGKYLEMIRTGGLRP
jgi:rod shape-determining protein MreB